MAGEMRITSKLRRGEITAWRAAILALAEQLAAEAGRHQAGDEAGPPTFPPYTDVVPQRYTDAAGLIRDHLSQATGSRNPDAAGQDSDGAAA